MTDSESAAPSSEDTAQEPKPGRFVPPRKVWIVVLLCLLCIVRLQSVADAAELPFIRFLNRWLHLIDNSFANVFTLILGFIALMALAIWFVRRSGYPRFLRLGLAATGILAVAVALVTLRIDYVTGEMVPSFSFRWTAKPDQLLPPAVVTPPVARAPTDEATGDDAPTQAGSSAANATRDFGQFLGPDRAAFVDDVALDHRWADAAPKQLWRQPIGAGWSAFAVVDGRAVTLEQRGDNELITCYEVDTGTLVWVHATPTRFSDVLGGVGPRSTPTIVEGRVYTLGATGALCCLDLATGQLAWSRNVLEDFGLTPEEDKGRIAWGRAASPLIVDQTVVVPAGGTLERGCVSLVAYHRITGDKVWEGGDHQISYSSPNLVTLGGTRQITIVNESTVSGHDPTTGHQLWQFDWPGQSNAAATASQVIALDGHRVFVSKGYGGGAAVFQIDRDQSEPDENAQDDASAQHSTDSWRTEELWHRRTVMKTKFTNVVARDGYAYGLSDGVLECIDLEQGHRQWKRGRYGHGQVLGVSDVLLVTTESGEVVLVDLNPEKHVELARFQAIEGKTWNNPALYGNRLLVRNAEEAACYELPVKPRP